MKERLYTKRIYNKFMEIISYFSNEEIEELAKSLLVYVENDRLF